jgi:DNA-binding NtrC family response regulator
MKLKQLLLVEPDAVRRVRFGAAVRSLAHVDARADFQSARARLLGEPYDWLVTNLRLQAYNGLHLVHLVKSSGRPTRSVVYGEHHDLALAREAQLTGAFFESLDSLDRALPAYLSGSLPALDRRELTRRDRRGAFRPGRRCTDVADLHLEG